MRGSVCWAKLPRAGLGNKLFVWARAAIFAQSNELPLWVSGFNQIRPRALLRRERARHYFHQFIPRADLSHVERFYAKLFLQRVYEPPPQKPGRPASTLYVFDEVPHWRDFFHIIRDHREFVRQQFHDLLAAPVMKSIEAEPTPVISVHVRHGDFRELQQGEDFSRVGMVRTPLDYFKGAISIVRSIAGEILPVTLFSDGSDAAIAPLLDLPHVRLTVRRTAAADMLLMSRSRVIIPSAGSTFSYWAAFLSDAAILLHPDHIHAPIRPDEVNGICFEGATPRSAIDCPPLLRNNIIATLDFTRNL